MLWLQPLSLHFCRGAPPRQALLTSQLLQGVKAAVGIIIRGEEMGAVEEVGPSHVDGFEGSLAGSVEEVAAAAAGLDQLPGLAARCQHSAAQQAQVGVTLAFQEVVQDAQQNTLRTGLRCCHRVMAQWCGEGCQPVGHIGADRQL